ncbi:MAG: hypothetical protein KC431_12565, partial [Myxococcales bacterium]|nr:hypothetical protein [Myxococcales bacterium]
MIALSQHPLVTTALSWMLTYAIHSTILILGVWLLCRGIPPVARRIGPRFENRAWKLALVGGLLTASVQVGLGVRPAFGAVELETGPEMAERSVQPVATPAAAPALAPVAPEPATLRGRVRHGQRELRLYDHGNGHSEVVVISGGGSLLAPVAPAAAPIAAPIAAAPVPPAVTKLAPVGPAPLWPALILLAWAVGTTWALVRLLSCVRTLRRRLKDRSTVLEDPVLESFLFLCSEAEINRKIRLTQSDRLASPIALWRREIVVPRRAVEELPPPAMHAVLAHELAHLERRDPHWLALAAVIEALFFFQPL